MNAVTAVAPIHRSARFRPPQNSQSSAAAEIAAKAKAVLRTSSSSPGVRALTGSVPIQLSTGVRSQNSARTAILRGASGHARPPASRPTDAPVTKGTSSIPQAPCSRGKISDCRRPDAIIPPSCRNPAAPRRSLPFSRRVRVARRTTCRCCRLGAAWRAGPAVVRRVRAEEQEAETEAPTGGEGDAGVCTQGSRIAGRWREVNQQVSTPIGQILRVRTPARFRGCPLISAKT